MSICSLTSVTALPSSWLTNLYFLCVMAIIQSHASKNRHRREWGQKLPFESDRS
jgi:hypothetical protein